MLLSQSQRVCYTKSLPELPEISYHLPAHTVFIHIYTSSFILTTLAVCKAELLHNNMLKSSVLIATFSTGRGEKIINLKHKGFWKHMYTVTDMPTNLLDLTLVVWIKCSCDMVSSGFGNIFVACTGNMMPTMLGLSCHWHMKRQD